MDRINEAIAKMTKECEKKAHLIPFEEYLTSICTNDNVAGRILTEEKTLEGCFEYMKAIAKKRAVAGCAYIPPEEGFEIIRKYYQIEDEQKASPSSVVNIMDFI